MRCYSINLDSLACLDSWLAVWAALPGFLKEFLGRRAKAIWMTCILEPDSRSNYSQHVEEELLSTSLGGGGGGRGMHGKGGGKGDWNVYFFFPKELNYPHTWVLECLLFFKSKAILRKVLPSLSTPTLIWRWMSGEFMPPDLRLLRSHWKVREEGLYSILSRTADGTGYWLWKRCLCFWLPAFPTHLVFSPDGWSVFLCQGCLVWVRNGG